MDPPSNSTIEYGCMYLWEHIGLEECLEMAYYVVYVCWLVYPVVVTVFILPAIILVFLYASALFLHVYKWRRRLRDAYSHDFWDGARKTLAALWDGQAKIWHGYEIVGLENIPDEGAALLIYYHGALPIDMYYIMAKVLLHKNRQLQAVGDRFLFSVPGFKLLMDVFCVQPGTVRSCVELMRQGHVLAIAPGGVREALFSDEFYGLKWASRTGFAKVAIEARVPVIPVFTENIREAFRSVSIARRYLRMLYERTRLPLVPIYGGFPVKLRTFVGSPVSYDPATSAEELTLKVRSAIEDMIRQHQEVPGSIVKALLQRATSAPQRLSDGKKPD